MEQYNENKMKDIYQKKFEGFEAEPASHVWNRIERQMEKEKSKAVTIRHLVVRWSVAASLIIGLVIGSYGFYKFYKDSISGNDNITTIQQQGTDQNAVEKTTERVENTPYDFQKTIKKIEGNKLAEGRIQNTEYSTQDNGNEKTGKVEKYAINQESQFVSDRGDRKDKKDKRKTRKKNKNAKWNKFRTINATDMEIRTVIPTASVDNEAPVSNDVASAVFVTQEKHTTSIKRKKSRLLNIKSLVETVISGINLVSRKDIKYKSVYKENDKSITYAFEMRNIRVSGTKYKNVNTIQ